jgi:hypothetical protein
MNEQDRCSTAAAAPAGDVEDVRRRYFRGGRLRDIPSKRKNRHAVLAAVAERVEHGRAYTEHEVNHILGAVYDDHCVLRRALVDEGLLLRTRSGSEYRRAEQRNADST